MDACLGRLVCRFALVCVVAILCTGFKTPGGRRTPDGACSRAAAPGGRGSGGTAGGRARCAQRDSHVTGLAAPPLHLRRTAGCRRASPRAPPVTSWPPSRPPTAPRGNGHPPGAPVLSRARDRACNETSVCVRAATGIMAGIYRWPAALSPHGTARSRVSGLVACPSFIHPRASRQ
jgi:hypothetical protein